MIWPPKTVPPMFACCGSTYSSISVADAARARGDELAHDLPPAGHVPRRGAAARASLERARAPRGRRRGSPRASRGRARGAIERHALRGSSRPSRATSTSTASPGARPRSVASTFAPSTRSAAHADDLVARDRCRRAPPPESRVTDATYARPPSVRIRTAQRARRRPPRAASARATSPTCASVAARSTSDGGADPRVEEIAQRQRPRRARRSPASRPRAPGARVAPYSCHRCASTVSSDDAPAAARADLEVEQRADDLALAVVADRAVRRVLVGAIELDPRVEARVLERLHEAPGRAVEVGDLAREVLEVLVHRRRAAQARRTRQS